VIPEDVRPVLQQLLERSKRREVEWAPSSVMRQRHGEVVVLFPNSSFVLSENENENSIEGRILNRSGDTALSFWASYRETDTRDMELLSELLDLARRKVLGADESLSEIKNAVLATGRVGELPNTKPVPSPLDDDDEVPF
jgi:hypothetical protein